MRREVTNVVDEVTLTATVNHAGASVSAVTLDGTAIADNDFTDGIMVPALIVGDNAIVVTVTAENGATRTYAVTVTRAAAVWSTTMTVGEGSRGQRGYSDYGPDGSLGSDSFTTGTKTFRVAQLVVTTSGELRVKLSRTFTDYARYTLEVAGETLPLSESIPTFITQPIDFRFSPTWLATYAPSLSVDEFETTLAIGDQVPVCLRTATQVCPGGNTTNNRAEGAPAISGTAQVGETLTADVSGIRDADGLPGSLTYRWVRVDPDGVSNETSVGSNSSTYTPAAADVGNRIRVRVSFTDNAGNREGPLTSDAYPSQPQGATVVAAQGSCPSGADWCATLTMGYRLVLISPLHLNELGLLSDSNFGLMDPAMFTGGSTTYTVTKFFRSLRTSSDGSIIAMDTLLVEVSGGTLPDGTVLNVGGTELTVDTDTPTSIAGQEQWDLQDLGISFAWVEGQKLTVSAKLGVAPGVTVSETALTVTEQDSTGDSYTVALDTEPTADVTVTVAGHAGTDVTPNPATLTFTASNWETAQTVTVTAGDDADTEDDTVALTHSATSADNDYGGIAIDEVAVTVSDNDTARVTGVSVTSGNAQLAVNWTAVDNATGYKVQWKSVGQDYNTGDRQFTIPSGTTTSHTITSLANGTEYTARVSATRTGANDGPPSAEAKGTPAAPGVTVSKTALTVTEQDTTGDSYTVALDTEPTANVTVTVAGHAGTDVTPDPTTLTFTASKLGNGADGDGDRGRRCGHDGRHGRADPQRGERGQRLQRHRDRRGGGDGERRRHRAGHGGVGDIGQRAAGGELGGGGQRHGLQGAVEVGRPGLQHRRPAVHDPIGYDDEPHDHGPGQRHRVHGSGERDADRRQRRSAVGGGAGHPGGADRAGCHGVEDGADGDGAGHDRGRLHGGAGYRADGGCHGDGGRARGHRRDPEPDHPDVHEHDLEPPRRR